MHAGCLTCSAREILNTKDTIGTSDRAFVRLAMDIDGYGAWALDVDDSERLSLSPYE